MFNEQNSHTFNWCLPSRFNSRFYIMFESRCPIKVVVVYEVKGDDVEVKFWGARFDQHEYILHEDNGEFKEAMTQAARDHYTGLKACEMNAVQLAEDYYK